MKKQFKLMLLALTIICVWSCNDDDSPRVVLFDVQIVALYPEDFNRESAEGVTIVLRNNATGSEKEAISGIAYDEFGKPCLENGAGQISVAHSGKYATLIISKTTRVGVDIEAIQPKIIKLAHKFLTKEEMEYTFASRTIESLCVIWCAKEALYKLQGGRGVVFSENIHINNFTFTGNGHLTGYVTREQKRSQYQVFYESLDDYILVYSIE